MADVTVTSFAIHNYIAKKFNEEGGSEWLATDLYRDESEQGMVSAANLSLENIGVDIQVVKTDGEDEIGNVMWTVSEADAEKMRNANIDLMAMEG